MHTTKWGIAFLKAIIGVDPDSDIEGVFIVEELSSTGEDSLAMDEDNLRDEDAKFNSIVQFEIIY